MESFWILGAGNFGSLAVSRLLEQKNARLVAVDRDAKALAKLRTKPIIAVEQDAIEFLLDRRGCGTEWIVPAVPVHVAFAWLNRQLIKLGRVEVLTVPVTIDHQVPNPLRDETGALYTSFATFLCPDDCDEPADRCVATGKARSSNLFDLLSQIEAPGYVVRVIRSHQLAPGVGGYQMSALWRLLEEVSTTAKDLLVATACRCHGVVHALRWRRT